MAVEGVPAEERAVLQLKRLVKLFCCIRTCVGQTKAHRYAPSSASKQDQKSTNSWRGSECFSLFQRFACLQCMARPLANVLPLVDKGLTVFQRKQYIDIVAAERCYNESSALRSDLQQGKIDKAAEMFEHQVQLARSEP